MGLACRGRLQHILFVVAAAFVREEGLRQCGSSHGNLQPYGHLVRIGNICVPTMLVESTSFDEVFLSRFRLDPEQVRVTCVWI